MHKSKRIEYKQKITAELEKEVVAFLNSNEGGVIYIGTNHKSLKFEKTEFVEISVPHRTKYLIIHYNKGKSKIPIRPEHEYLYIEFRNKNLLEVVYSVSKPAYT